MKKVAIIFCLLTSILMLAQVDASVDRRKGRWVFGGGLGLGFNRGFNIQANPDIGYRTMRMEFGASVGINYQKYNGDNVYRAFKNTLWNLGPYLIYMPTQHFFLRGQYQYYTGSQKIEGFQDFKINESTLWIGGGYQDIVAEHVYYRIGVMYNVLYDEETSIFTSGFLPIFGISVGI